MKTGSRSLKSPPLLPPPGAALDCQTYVLQTPLRRIVMKITHHADRIVICYDISRAGIFGDEPQIDAWLASLLQPLLAEGRVVVLESPTTGEICPTFQTANGAVSVYP